MRNDTVKKIEKPINRILKRFVILGPQGPLYPDEIKYDRPYNYFPSKGSAWLHSFNLRMCFEWVVLIL